MIVPIIKYGSPLLRKHSIDITGEDNPIQLSQNLLDTLKKAGGIGLAAPQMGILKRAFVIDTSPLSEEDNNIEKIEKAFFNPEITWRSEDKIYYSEGCLSIPDIFEDILRPQKIRVKYFDANLNIIEDEFDGLIARIFQHEYDHLDGILFIDKLNPLKRRLLNGKLNKIKKSN
ncbi:MAG: peptide deformylase [Bacteroidales bacterium]